MAKLGVKASLISCVRDRKKFFSRFSPLLAETERLNIRVDPAYTRDNRGQFVVSRKFVCLQGQMCVFVSSFRPSRADAARLGNARFLVGRTIDPRSGRERFYLVKASDLMSGAKIQWSKQVNRWDLLSAR
ncbi:MAG: hypothetical protein UY20_C0001G0006 [Candidatus Yanofskybacteria bacterium GW2011_GWA1_48_10]|uniref:Uncharacterized protein n=2 Tax=Candidatus Yanofskyibacteriota TaxID=1752733 RepID=A0A0G1X6Y9_9BACT|nr:MAG: hypothetical protein UY20_C0001G0006 [Candidatus Yanofskybacteria bacterium GW2011_GWA1_48_10]OGN06573.1 MAG: hypothetical protein A2669_02935 [Candidatus Yanofskybacteria bacterium RIFCSPHIGHO2_01_FULL_48_25b]